MSFSRNVQLLGVTFNITGSSEHFFNSVLEIPCDYMLLLKHTFVHGHFLQLTYGFHHQFEHCILGTGIAGTVFHTSVQKRIQRQKIAQDNQRCKFPLFGS